MDHIMLTEELEQTLEAFIEYLRLERNASPLTLTTYRPAIISYMECALELASDEWQPSDADRDLVRNWIMQQMDDELTSTTVNKNLSAVKSSGSVEIVSRASSIWACVRKEGSVCSRLGPRR